MRLSTGDVQLAVSAMQAALYPIARPSEQGVDRVAPL